MLIGFFMTRGVLADGGDTLLARAGDGEDVEEPPEVEELAYLAGEAAEREPAARFLRPLGGQEEDPEARAADVLELTEVEQEPRFRDGQAAAQSFPQGRRGVAVDAPAPLQDPDTSRDIFTQIHQRLPPSPRSGVA